MIVIFILVLILFLSKKEVQLGLVTIKYIGAFGEGRYQITDEIYIIIVVILVVTGFLALKEILNSTKNESNSKKDNDKDKHQQK